MMDSRHRNTPEYVHNIFRSLSDKGRKNMSIVSCEMNMEAENGRLSLNQARPECKVCDSPPRIAFNWQYAQENESSELNALFNNLKPVKRLKFGHLYSCQLCGLNWLLEDSQYAMARVPNDRMNILNEWDSKKLSINQEQLHVLDSIGGTEPRYWMGRDEVIMIPCAISTCAGVRIDPALIWITKRPPIDAFTSRIRLYQDIGVVEPSRYALPMEVRRATFLAPEISMGFSPTRVVAKDGTPFVLHWATSLFNQDGITGSEITLSKKPFRREESVKIAEADTAHATYFFADWFEGAEKLNKVQLEKPLSSTLRVLWKRLF